jgi:hypothetical protein
MWLLEEIRKAKHAGHDPALSHAAPYMLLDDRNELGEAIPSSKLRRHWR